MYDQIIVLEYESVTFRIHITCSTLWDTVDDNYYATTKTSKIEKINEKGKKLNPHASISTLRLFMYMQSSRHDIVTEICNILTLFT